MYGCQGPTHVLNATYESISYTLPSSVSTPYLLRLMRA